jgi:hypothetical protein
VPNQHGLQFGQRRSGRLLNRGTQQRPFCLLQLWPGAPAMPRGQVLPGPRQSEHLFDKRHPDTKQGGNSRNRQVPLLDGCHHTRSEFFGVWSHTVTVSQSHTLANRYKTIRPHLFNLAGKLVHTARQVFLVISDSYRYQAVWQFAMHRLPHLQFG